VIPSVEYIVGFVWFTVIFFQCSTEQTRVLSLAVAICNSASVSQSESRIRQDQIKV
jgi:hypothetical protein